MRGQGIAVCLALTPIVLTLLSLYAAPRLDGERERDDGVWLPRHAEDSCRGDPVLGSKVRPGLQAYPGSWAHALTHRRLAQHEAVSDSPTHRSAQLGPDRADGRPMKPALSFQTA